MEPEASEEVRDLLEYPDSTVGSLMTTEVLTFYEDQTIAEVLDFIRDEQPDMETLYGLFVIDKRNTLTGTITMIAFFCSGKYFRK